jgi:hypothetical protein
MIFFLRDLPQCRKTLAGWGFQGIPTLPIIGRSVGKWNRFSIFICHEISVASGSPIA